MARSGASGGGARCVSSATTRRRLSAEGSRGGLRTGRLGLPGPVNRRGRQRPQRRESIEGGTARGAPAGGGAVPLPRCVSPGWTPAHHRLSDRACPMRHICPRGSPTVAGGCRSDASPTSPGPGYPRRDPRSWCSPSKRPRVAGSPNLRIVTSHHAGAVSRFPHDNGPPCYCRLCLADLTVEPEGPCA